MKPLERKIRPGVSLGGRWGGRNGWKPPREIGEAANRSPHGWTINRRGLMALHAIMTRSHHVPETLCAGPDGLEHLHPARLRRRDSRPYPERSRCSPSARAKRTHRSACFSTFPGFGARLSRAGVLPGGRRSSDLSGQWERRNRRPHCFGSLAEPSGLVPGRPRHGFGRLKRRPLSLRGRASEERLRSRRLYERARSVIAGTSMASRHDTDDLLHEALASLLAEGRLLDESIRFDYRVRDLAWNAARRHDRRLARERPLPNGGDLDDRSLRTSGREPALALPYLVEEMAALDSERPSEKRRAEEDLALLVARDVMGYSAEEIGERVGLLANTVNQRIRRRVCRLRLAEAS